MSSDVPASILFGAVAASIPWLALLDANVLALIGRDSAVLLAWMLVLFGVPSALMFLILARCLRGRSGRGARRTALLGVGVVGLAFIVLLARGAEPPGLLAVRAAPLAIVLAGISLTRAPRGRSAIGRLVGWAAAAVLFSSVASVWVGEATVRPIEIAPAAVSPSIGPAPGRIVIIGVDGLCWETLGRWGGAGSEDLEWLRRRAYVGPLRTIEPAQSPRVWTSIATGMPPSEHGVLGYTSWALRGMRHTLTRMPRLAGDPYWVRAWRALRLVSYRSVGSPDARRPPIWEIIDAPDRPVSVIGWWGTWPAYAINGQMVSDKFYFWREERQSGSVDSTRLTYPAGLEEVLAPLRVPPAAMTVEEIRSFIDLPDDEASGLADRPYVHHDILSELPLAYTMDETYAAVAEAFLAAGAPHAICAVYLRGVDIVSHSAMHLSSLYPEGGGTPEELSLYGEVISRYYACVFQRVRRLVELAGEDAVVIVVSDHGFEKMEHRLYDHPNGPPGVIIAVGGGAAGATLEEPASVYDVAPTVLWLAGYPVADDMAGRPLLELFPNLGAPPREVSRCASYGCRTVEAVRAAPESDAADERMIELLRGLGYLN